MRPTLHFMSLVLISLALAASPVRAADSDATVERFIVKFRTTLSVQDARGDGESLAKAAVDATDQRVRSLATRARMSMTASHAIGPNLHVMQVTPVEKGEATEQALARLAADPEVEYAVPDRKMYVQAVPTDTLYSGQWHLQALQPSAINATAAWDITKGDDSVVIAVLDTGIRFDHPDLAGRTLTGYDFVSGEPTGGTFDHANDGNGRDTDASDPGDWCDGKNSSWHGTRVSGIIGAATNNGRGVAGITWSGKILPVRVIGKCGGYNSDVIAGMYWAAGVSFSGSPPLPPQPAKILNMSLGGVGSCDAASRDAMLDLSSRGVLVVVAAGNEGGPVDSPANCPGAMGIAGLRHIGTKVGYSSLGPEIKLAAPAGNCPGDTAGACEFSLDTTTNAGPNSPVLAPTMGSEGYTGKTDPTRNIGTSFSSPIVAGIAGLMLAVNPGLRATHLISRLQEGSTAFPTSSTTVPAPPVCHTPASSGDIQGSECICTTSVCGAGMANANGAVQAALRPVASIANPGTVTPGASITLNGSSSAAATGHSIASYTWIQGSTTLSTGATTNVTAPASGTTSVCLTVVDELGKQDTAVAAITSSSVTITSADAGKNPCLTEVTVSATDASASEAAGDTGTFTFTRTGSTAAALAVTVAYSGAAANGTSYQTLGTAVTFAPGSATSTVTVTPIDNTAVDGSRTVIVTVVNSAGYVAGSPATATVTISDNDTPAPAPQSSGGGGGGALDALSLLGLALALLGLMSRRALRPRQPQQLRQHIRTK